MWIFVIIIYGRYLKKSILITVAIHSIVDTDQYHSCTEGDIGFESSLENLSDGGEVSPSPSPSVLGKPKSMKPKKAKKPAGVKKGGKKTKAAK